VRLDAGGGKGKGVFATRRIEAGETIFEELPMVRGMQLLALTMGRRRIVFWRAAALAAAAAALTGRPLAWFAAPRRAARQFTYSLFHSYVRGHTHNRARTKAGTQHAANRAEALLCGHCFRPIGERDKAERGEEREEREGREGLAGAL
jgi:hypothetical protein